MDRNKLEAEGTFEFVILEVLVSASRNLEEGRMLYELSPHILKELREKLFSDKYRWAIQVLSADES